jgi:hypothetical protein
MIEQIAHQRHLQYLQAQEVEMSKNKSMKKKEKDKQLYQVKLVQTWMALRK